MNACVCRAYTCVYNTGEFSCGVSRFMLHMSSGLYALIIEYLLVVLF